MKKNKTKISTNNEPPPTNNEQPPTNNKQPVTNSGIIVSDSKILNQADIGRITGYSQSYISKVKTGKIGGEIKSDEVARLLTASGLDIANMIKDSRLYDVCEVAIMRGKTSATRKYAMLLQQVHLKLNYEKKKED